MDHQENGKALDRYLSPIDVWAMAFGAIVGFGYTSAAAWKLAKAEGNRRTVLTGAAGTAISALFAWCSLCRGWPPWRPWAARPSCC